MHRDLSWFKQKTRRSINSRCIGSSIRSCSKERMIWVLSGTIVSERKHPLRHAPSLIVSRKLPCWELEVSIYRVKQMRHDDSRYQQISFINGWLEERIGIFVKLLVVVKTPNKPNNGPKKELLRFQGDLFWQFDHPICECSGNLVEDRDITWYADSFIGKIQELNEFFCSCMIREIVQRCWDQVQRRSGQSVDVLLNLSFITFFGDPLRNEQAIGSVHSCAKPQTMTPQYWGCTHAVYVKQVFGNSNVRVFVKKIEQLFSCTEWNPLGVPMKLEHTFSAHVMVGSFQIPAQTREMGSVETVKFCEIHSTKMQCEESIPSWYQGILMYNNIQFDCRSVKQTFAFRVSMSCWLAELLIGPPTAFSLLDAPKMSILACPMPGPHQCDDSSRQDDGVTEVPTLVCCTASKISAVLYWAEARHALIALLRYSTCEDCSALNRIIHVYPSFEARKVSCRNKDWDVTWRDLHGWNTQWNLTWSVSFIFQNFRSHSHANNLRREWCRFQLQFVFRHGDVAGSRFEMGRISNSIWWHFGRIVTNEEYESFDKFNTVLEL